MGQANKRGTFDQRQSKAYEAIDALDAARAVNLKVLDQHETDSTKNMEVAVSQAIVRHWNQTGMKRRIPATFIGAYAPESFNEEVAVMAGKELAKIVIDGMEAA